MRRISAPLLVCTSLLLSACHAVVLNPAGDVAAQQRDLVIDSTVLMLLIILPVMALTVLFAWKYRASNRHARYEPDWDHSTQLELVIWAGPLLIIICLGALTWVGTHLLDPYRTIGRIQPGRALSSAAEPLEVEVISLDWKWLFIYPQYGVATINELAAPLNRPIDFRITSSSVMNSFYIPALAGQIYAMPGMETTLHAVLNQGGDYSGFSANYSGAGFSGMHFGFHGLSDSAFETWIARVRAAGGRLDRAAYAHLETPSENEPPRYFGAFEPGLFRAIVGQCVEPGKMCASEMSAIDARGGLGLAGIYNVHAIEYDKYARRGESAAATRGYVVQLCRRDEPLAPTHTSGRAVAADDRPLLGLGLPRPHAADPQELLPALAGTQRPHTLF